MKKLSFLLLAAVFFTSCKKDDPEPALSIDNTELELKFDGTHQFVVKKGNENVTASSLTWTSSDELVGSVDANGKFTARKIGETTIKGTGSNGNVESKVKIVPYITNIIEPVVKFGATKAQIKADEKRTLLEEADDALAYNGTTGSYTDHVIYTFTDGKMDGAILQLTPNITQQMIQNIATFLLERYPETMEDEGEVYSLDDKMNHIIVTTEHELLGPVMVYLPYSILNARVSNYQSVQNILEKAASQIAVN